ncbi:Mpo1-like protein [uncultured Pseudoalteromonas sp.]|nr:Mpo1-like protein [uncultured Pseudoalteromonas sp.]
MFSNFFFEKNRPATFTHPFYSFIGDWVMFKDIIIRKVPF